MKTIFTATLIALVAAVSTPVLAASDHGNHAAMSSHADASGMAKMVDGQVKKVDKPAGKVTLAHGPLVHLGMDMPMTMVFRVKDAAWLDQVKEGDKIRFVADKVNGAFTVIQLESAK